jgi:hypothetical protein
MSFFQSVLRLICGVVSSIVLHLVLLFLNFGRGLVTADCVVLSRGDLFSYGWRGFCHQIRQKRARFYL